MLWKVDVVSLNELHAAHQSQLNTLLAFHPGVAFLGFARGDAVEQ